MPVKTISVKSVPFDSSGLAAFRGALMILQERYRGVTLQFECVHRRATKQHGSCNKVMWSAGIDDLKFTRFPTKFRFCIVLLILEYPYAFGVSR